MGCSWWAWDEELTVELAGTGSCIGTYCWRRTSVLVPPINDVAKLIQRTSDAQMSLANLRIRRSHGSLSRLPPPPQSDEAPRSSEPMATKFPELLLEIWY